MPNLLEPGAAVDLVVPVGRHSEVKRALDRIAAYSPAPEEPSVWVARDPDKLEINFVGLDSALREASETYVLEDDKLPLLVFGLLSYLREGPLLEIGDLRVRLPRPAGLLIEKLLTERSGLKGERDLLAALGLLQVCGQDDLEDFVETFAGLTSEQRGAVLSNLTVLSLMKPIPEMPDPAAGREEVARLKTSLASLHARAGAIRSRALIHRWEMRRLGRASGVWFRLGRLLALSRSAWALSESDAEILVAAGYSPHPVGLELEPPRRLFVIAEDQLASLASAREVPLRASAEILGCRALALVPFEGLDRGAAQRHVTVNPRETKLAERSGDGCGTE